MCVYRLCYMLSVFFVFFFKQKTAYDMRISDWSSDVGSSDLAEPVDHRRQLQMTIGCEGETRARRRLILCLGAPFGEARRGRRVEKEGRAEQRRDLFRSEERRVGKEGP